MVRWLKLFGDQYFGFWVLGLVLFAIQEIPYMVMPLVKMEANPIMNMVETSAALDACEKILGSLCIALMIFVVHRDAVLFSISEGRERLFPGMGSVFHGTSERFRDDVFHSADAAAVLCGDRALEA